MGTDYRLNQHLKMSPNAQVKNLVPENLSDIPPEDEWKLGRFWFNTTIGKLQGVFLKLDTDTGLPVEPQTMEIRIVGADALGPTKDGEYWPDGLFAFNEQTKISDAMDEVNEALKDLAPAEATFLNGDLSLEVNGGFKAGRISRGVATSPDQLRMTGVFEGDFINYITTDDGVRAVLPTVGYVVKDKQQSQFGRADQGIITAFFDYAQTDNGVNLFDNFKESSRDYFGAVQGFNPSINQNITSVDGTVSNIEVNPNKDLYRSSTGSLTIETVERYNDFKKWQKGTGIVNFGKLVGQDKLTPGRHTFFVRHTDTLGGPFETNESEIFYDPNTTAPSTTINNFVISTGNTKYVSGIPFYNSNISFSLDLVVTDAFSYTYWDKPIELIASKTNATKVSWNDTSSNLSGDTIPQYDDEIQLSNFIINYNGVNSTEEEITLYAKAGKVATSWGTIETTHIQLLIDTTPISGSSTWLKETFNDEDFRIPSNTDFSSMSAATAEVGQWDSTILLESGNAQEYMGNLQSANRDYNSFSVNVDYTSFSGTTQKYFRPFKADGKPNSNGTLKISSTADIGVGKDIEVLIKFPGLTGWLVLTELYDIQEFSNHYTEDGIVGCASNIETSTFSTTIDWTIGTNSTVNSGYGYIIQVIINNDTVKISEIEEISQNWR